jgi:hypothetical protein
MAMPKEGGLDPGGRAEPIRPNLLAGFAARRLLHNLISFFFVNSNRAKPFAIGY